MNRIMKFSLLFCLLAIGTSSVAQDIHFTQFYMSPLNLNPAMTGVNNCKSRFVANYRNQWASAIGSNAYNTYSVSYDQKMPVGREDYFGLGGSLWGDVAGETRFGTTQGRLSFSYSKKMAGYRKSASYLVVGADAALTQRSISQNDFRWPTQINPVSGHDPTIDPMENINDFDFIYPDIAAGLLWFSVIDERTNWYMGAALHHLNQPNVSFYDDVPVSLYSRITLHGGAQFPMTRRISLLPFGIYMSQGPHKELNIGSSVRFAMGPSRSTGQSFQLGLWYRGGTQATFTDGAGNTGGGGIHSDAVILSSRFNYDRFSIGLSYDLNISQLKAAGSANGAFEFSLKYEICGPESRGVYCPRF